MYIRRWVFYILFLFLPFICFPVTQEIVTLNDGTQVVIYFYNNGKMKRAEEYKPNGDKIIVFCNHDGKIVSKEIFRADGLWVLVEFEITGQMKTKEEHRTDGTVLMSYYINNEERLKDVESLLDGTKIVNFYFANTKYQTKVYRPDNTLQIIYYDNDGEITTVQNYDSNNNMVSEEEHK